MTARTTVSKEVEFDTGHRVPDHGSKCRHPHGHRYRLRVTCAGEVVDEPGSTDHGMVVDFGDLKRWMTERVHDVLDHGMVVARTDHDLRNAMLGTGHLDDFYQLVEMGDGWWQQPNPYGWNVVVVDWSPTAENLARWCWDQLEPVVAEHWRGNMHLALVELWETPTSVATYVR